MSVKKLVGLCVLLGVMQATLATEITVEERCEIIAEVAASIMQGRQNGAAKEAVLATVQVEDGPEITELFEEMVHEAYSTEIEDISRRKKVQVQEFSQYWHRSCLKGMSTL